MELHHQTTILIMNKPLVGQFGPRDFDKYVFRIPFPRFNANDELHIRIARAAAQAEKIAAAMSLPEGVGFQKARRMIRTELSSRDVTEQIEAAVGDLLAPPSALVPTDSLFNPRHPPT